MSESALLFVSERLQRPIAALICLAFVQLATAGLSSCTAPRTAAATTSVQVAIRR